MNKYLYTIIRIFQWLYIGAYVLYFLFVGYELIIRRFPIPPSAIPILSITLIQSDANALESRVVLPASAQYTASTSGVFGRLEPFNP